MSSRNVFITGVTLVRSRDAARIVKFTSNYISRLARADIIDGRLIDGSWFVDRKRGSEPKNNASPVIRRLSPNICRNEKN